MSESLQRGLVILLLGVLGIALVGVLYHNKQKQEPVWADGEAALQWDKKRLPLRVSLSESLEDGYAASLSSAIAAINTRVGCELFVWKKDDLVVDVRVMHEGCDDPGDAGCAYYDKAKDQGLVKVGFPGDVTQAYLVFHHELGHLLGLAHDGPADPETMAVSVSAMADNVASFGSRLDKLPRFTDKDTQALRDRYCQ